MSASPKPLSIMIDGYNLGMERGTGVATYGRNLSYECHNLGYNTELLYGLDIGSQRRSKLLREVMFFSQSNSTTAVQRFRRTLNRVWPRFFQINAESVPVTGNVITRYFQSRMPYFDRLWNTSDLFEVALHQFGIFNKLTRLNDLSHVDIMHWTYPLPIRLPNARNIYTLHDLVPLRLPYTTLDNKEQYLRLMRRIVATADHIVTVSETSRTDIINILDCPPEKVTNTYQSVDIPKKLLEKSDDDVRAEVEGVFGLPYKEYFLFFGAIEPKKNVNRLVEAYLTGQVNEPLAIIGPTAWKADQELRLFNEYKAQSQPGKDTGDVKAAKKSIFRFEFIPFPLLISAIRGAKATVFPSLYEGFGLPILESMLLGTPVITSSEGATAEIAGDAAILIDPYDTRALAEAMRAMSQDANLRTDLIARGKRRAEYFSPEKYRSRLQALYSKLK